MKRDIEVLLLKLADNARVLRLSEPQSGLCLEKRLDPDQSVARQEQRWKELSPSDTDPRPPSRD